MNSVIIVAGGSGTRMKNVQPKQFIILNDKPILMHTIERFHHYDKEMQIIVVLAEDHISLWQNLCDKYHFTIPHTIALGGKERFYSVKNGLAKVDPNTSIVAIHDGVRPIISYELINNCICTAAKFGSAIPTTAVIDSLRKIDGESGDSNAVERSLYRNVQTPQCFKYDIISRAYNEDYSPFFTDDASVVENINEHITLCDGDYDNIKITTPNDLILAEFMLKKLI